MRINVAATTAGVDRKDLERWMKEGLVKFIHNNRERAIVNSELPILRLLPNLLEAGLTEATAFTVARQLQVKRPVSVSPTETLHTIHLAEGIRLLIVQPKRSASDASHSRAPI